MVRIRAQERLFLEGDLADRLYLLVSGRLRVLVEGDDGPRVLRLLGPGAAIGELAVLTGTKRSASVQAVRDSELLQIDSERFRELVHSDSELAAGLATALARQLQESGGLQEIDAPPAVFAVSAVTNVNAHLFWLELQSAFDELGSTAAVSGPAPEMWSDDWAVSLAELERTHSHVLLLAEPDDDWAQFCFRQADRVVILADGLTRAAPGAPGLRRLPCTPAPATVAKCWMGKPPRSVVPAPELEPLRPPGASRGASPAARSASFSPAAEPAPSRTSVSATCWPRMGTPSTGSAARAWERCASLGWRARLVATSEWSRSGGERSRSAPSATTRRQAR